VQASVRPLTPRARVRQWQMYLALYAEAACVQADLTLCTDVKAHLRQALASP